MEWAMTISAFTSRALGLLLTGGLVACSDFLDVTPKGELAEETFFATPDHAIQATNATYSALREWGVHVFGWIGQTDIASDDATKGSIPGDANYQGDLDALSFDAANLTFTMTWPAYYEGIRRANVAIQGIPTVPMDAQLKARLIGENKFLRAYYYFFLVRAYGGLPLITRPLTTDELVQTRATVDETYDLVEQDLLDAIAVLPASYPAEDLGRVTRWATRGLLAQVYLFHAAASGEMSDYANALQQAQAVVDSGGRVLLANYDTIFTRAGENSSETVFEVQAAINPGAGCDPTQGCSNIQYFEVQGVRGTPNIGWGFNTPSPSLETEYEPGDPRLQSTIMYPWELIPDGTGRVVHRNAGMENNRYNQKAFISPETPGGPFNGGGNIRRLRYADVLLIAAEAAHQTGNDGLAQTYLNQVRARARGGRTVTLGFTPELLNETIATSVLGLPAGGSRVFVRFVRPGTAAHTAGLRSFYDRLCTSNCPASPVPPVRADTIDLIQTVDGSPVTTPQQFLDTINTRSVGSTVTLGVLRIRQDSLTGAVTSTSLSVPITAQALLANVTVTGQPLLEAIWHERRVELAMEQHRMFDIRRQDAVSPGRAAALMTAHGRTWLPRHALYPIPTTEVQIAGLQQNPGY
jgi:hypothetical protein